MATTVRYHFRQHFQIAAQEAFDWCTDFRPEDQALKGYINSQREITKIADDVIILKDTTHTAAGVVEKQKLVQLYPAQLSWVATHLSGPNKYSQFLYQISPYLKGGSLLDFTALHLEYDNKAEAEMLSARLCQVDSSAWKLLANAMAGELQKK